VSAPNEVKLNEYLKGTSVIIINYKGQEAVFEDAAAAHQWLAELREGAKNMLAELQEELLNEIN
jgi:hypothetical protein